MLFVFVSQCKCLDPKNQGKPAATCGSAQYKGDGNCDDNNNNEGCEFDGGDCCAKSVKGGEVRKDYCKAVGCDDSGYRMRFVSCDVPLGPQLDFCASVCLNIHNVLHENYFSASASIRRTRASRSSRPAGRLSTRETAIAMTTTTIKAASSMAATAAPKV